MANYVISEEGTKTINIGAGNSTLSFKENNPNYKVELRFSPVATAQGSWQEYMISENDLIIRNNVSVGNRNIVQKLTIKDYFKNFGNTEPNYLQSNIIADFYFSEPEEITIASLQYKNIIIEGLPSRNNTLDGSDLEFDYIRYVGGNYHDIMTGNPYRPAIYSTGTAGSAVVNSGSESDYFDIWYATSDVEIYDKGGNNDTLYIGEYRLHGQGWNLFFDVINNETRNDVIPLEFKGLVILKDDKIQNWFKYEKTPGSISINDWFDAEGNKGKGYIEKIAIADGIDASLSEDIDEHIQRVKNRVLQWFSENDPDGKYQTAKEALMDPTLNPTLKNKLIACYTQESCPIRLVYQEELFPGQYDEVEYWGVEKGEFYGSNGNDVIYSTTNSTVKGCAGNDKLYRGNYQEHIKDESGYLTGELSDPKAAIDYKLYGEDGNDVLEAGKNVLIDGGSGENAILVDSESDVTILQGRGQDYIHLVEDSIDDFEFTKDGNTLIMQAEDGAKITLKDYFKYNAKSSIKGIADSGTSYNKDDYADEIVANIKNASAGNTIGEILSRESVELDIVPIPIKNTINGTNYNDNIDASELTLTKTIGKGKNKQTINRVATDSGLTINGGNGDDEIYGTQYSDIIKGGNGNNELFGEAGNDKIYTGNGLENLIEGNTGNDTIYCEKGSSIIRFNTGDGDDVIYTGIGNDSLEFAQTDLHELSFSVSKNDLIINHGSGDSVRIVNYFKAKGNTSIKTIYAKDCLEGSNFKDLMETAEIIINGNDEKKNNITGTYLADIITGGKYNDTLNGGNGNDEINGGAGNDTLIGGNGDDTLFGGEGNDIIKGGNGGDVIYGGTGNDKLYGEGSHPDNANSFHFFNGDGQDTIYMGKGTDTIYLESKQETAPTYIRKGNNLVITYGDDDTITVADYFKSKYTSVKTVEYALYNSVLDDYENKTDVISDDIIVQGEIVDSISKSYTGNDKNNLIYTNGKIGYVAAGAGNDIIQINNSVGAIVSGGFGDDYYEINSLNKSILIDDAGGTDKLWINEKSNNINVLFDVSADGSEITGDFSSMLIINDANYKTLKRYWDFDRVTAGTEVLDGDSAIEYIYSKNNQMIDVNNLRSKIATWLTSSGRNYVSAMDVLNQGDSDDIEVLLQMYQDAWEPAN